MRVRSSSFETLLPFVEGSWEECGASNQDPRRSPPGGLTT